MDRDLRASLVAACAAAALSSLIGIIAGVGLAVLFLRALVCGLLFGAAAYGGIALIGRMLPGVLDSSGPAARETAAESAAAPELGANVDIVLPGDAAIPGSAQQLEDILPAAPEPASGAAAPAASGEGDAIDEPSLLEPEEEAEAAIPIDAGRERGPRPSAAFDELDVLPDLDGFSDSFTASEFASGGSSSERQDAAPPHPSAGASSASRAGQGNLDSVALAQAVRTILKRDQKG